MKKFKYIGTEKELKGLGFQKGFSNFYLRGNLGEEIYIDIETKMLYCWRFKTDTKEGYAEDLVWKVESSLIKDLINNNLVVEV